MGKKRQGWQVPLSDGYGIVRSLTPGSAYLYKYLHQVSVALCGEMLSVFLPVQLSISSLYAKPGCEHE